MPLQLALHVCFRNFKWPLRDNDDVQVWQGFDLVATLPGRLIRHLVELHLAGAMVQREVQALVKPPVVMPSRAILAHREELRRKRRSRMKSLLIVLPLVLTGCLSGPSWVTRAGGPIDPLHELRCDEYVMAKNGPRYTGFESYDLSKCMRSHGYVRPSEVGR